MDGWEITDAMIVYRGLRRALPEFLPGFTIPVPKAWFDALFRERRKKKEVVYQADAYMVATGDIIYDCQTAHAAVLWADAMKDIRFAIQVEWAETPRAKGGRSLAIMEVSILRPDWRGILEKQQTVMTTQGRFLAFLRSGQLEDLDRNESIEQLKLVSELDDALLRQMPQLLSVEDIHQWAQGYYPNEENTEKRSIAVDVPSPLCISYQNILTDLS